MKFDTFEAIEKAMENIKSAITKTVEPIVVEVRAVKAAIGDAVSRIGEVEVLASRLDNHLTEANETAAAALETSMEAVKTVEQIRGEFGTFADDAVRIIDERVATIEVKHGVDGKDGTNGLNGDHAPFVESVYNDGGQLHFVMSDGKSFAITAPSDGEDGKDGVGIHDIDINEAGELFYVLTNNKEVAFNIGKVRGEDGDSITSAHVDVDGKLSFGTARGKTIDVEDIRLKADVVNGVDGKDAPKIESISIADDSREIEIVLSDGVKHFIPAPKDGKDGVDGKDAPAIEVVKKTSEGRLVFGMSDGKSFEIDAPKDGKDGVDGTNGLDGVNLVDALIDSENRLVLTTSNGTVKTLDVVVGSDGKDGVDGAPGKNGADGFGFDDMAMEYDGERGLSIVYSQGDRVKSIDFHLPIPIYRGQFDSAKSYERGDMVTHFGAVYHFDGGDNGIPGSAKSWQLSIRAGVDGKAGAPGTPGKPGKKGETGRPGRDLTQIGPDGSKW